MGFMKATVLALALLKQLEGWREKPYKDGGNKLTVGYGHLMRPDEKYTKITKEKGEALFALDVQEAEDIVNNAVTVDLEQSEFDALVLFVYNIGGEKFLKSGTLRVLNSGDYAGALARMQLWNKITMEDGTLKVSRGLKNRRTTEAKVWHGNYPKVS